MTLPDKTARLIATARRLSRDAHVLATALTVDPTDTKSALPLIDEVTNSREDYTRAVLAFLQEEA